MSISTIERIFINQSIEIKWLKSSTYMNRLENPNSTHVQNNTWQYFITYLVTKLLIVMSLFPVNQIANIQK